MTAYTIEALDAFVREMPPARTPFVLGRQTPATGAVSSQGTPTAYVRLRLADDRGRSAVGCAADRMSVRWLDKRPNRAERDKLVELAALINRACGIWKAEPTFKAPFDKWLVAHQEVLAAGRAARQEDLSSALASSLCERAMLDAVARIEETNLFQLVQRDMLGLRLDAVHPELRGFDLSDSLPKSPRTRFHIRHTVGLADPLTVADVTDETRVGDGLPECLAEYIERDGIRYFKVKVGGQLEEDLAWLARVWRVAATARDAVITLDANEAYADLGEFLRFVERLRRDQPELWNHILFIEQPVPREVSLSPAAAGWIGRVAIDKPVIIDEADATLASYPRAHALGYSGTSHKNCKGFLKSLVNVALVDHHRRLGRAAILSGEDLTNLPIVPLHQDFVSLGVLGISHCERNGHHYHHGLAHLSASELATIAERHTDLYERRDDGWYLRVRSGMVECGSLQRAPYGVFGEPDWLDMSPLDRWSPT